MAHKIGDYLLESANNPGTGTINLAGAPSGRTAFSVKLSSGDTTCYFVTDGTMWECGVGTFTAGTPNTLSRDTVKSNDLGTTAKRNFTGAVQVYSEVPAEFRVYLNPAGIVVLGDTGKTVSLGGSLATSGAYSLSFTLSGTTALTLPASGTVLSTAGSFALSGTYTGGTFSGPTVSGSVSGTSTFTGSVNDSPTVAGVSVGVVAGNFSIAQFYNSAGNLIDFSTTSGSNYQFRVTQTPNTLSVSTDIVSSVQTIDRATGRQNTLGAVSEGGVLVQVGDTVGGANTGMEVCRANSAGANAAAAALYLRKNSSTSRSLNAAGTVNASGADYAEYERKRDDCGAIAKGQVVGFDADNRLTDKWALAVTFGVKSTDPAIVGGDVWGSEEALGISRPVEPIQPVKPVPPVKPDDLTEPDRGEDEGESAWIARLASYDRDLAAFQMLLDHYEQAAAAWPQEWSDYQAAHAAYLEQKATFDAALEDARQAVDRIAYAGKVPVNVLGARPGQYIIAAQDGDGIKGEAVDILTDAARPYVVGRVRSILPDGRAYIAVLVS